MRMRKPPARALAWREMGRRGEPLTITVVDAGAGTITSIVGSLGAIATNNGDGTWTVRHQKWSDGADHAGDVDGVAV